MNIDFTNDIIKLKRREVVYRPFRQQNSESVYIFEEREDKIVKVAFENVESIANYLSHVGYDWDKNNYDNEQRLFKLLPELQELIDILEQQGEMPENMEAPMSEEDTSGMPKDMGALGSM